MSPSVRTKMLSEILPPAAIFQQGADIAVTGISQDSRQVSSGDLFVAKQGISDSGSKYIEEALAKGACAVLTDDSDVGVEQDEVSLAYLPDLDKTLSGIAGTFYDAPSLRMSVTGVTGTNGKTSCCYWYAWLSNQLGRACGQIGTLGAGYQKQLGDSLTVTGMTTPDAVRVQSILADAHQTGAEAVVMEVSSHALDQGRVEAVNFESAIFTNLTQDHLDYHGDMDAYFAAKASLFGRDELQRVVLNRDDASFDRLAASLKAETKLYSYSLSQAVADLFVDHVSWTEQGAQVVLDGQWGRLDTLIPVVGDYNLANVLAVTTALLSTGFDSQTVVAALANLPAVPGRMQLVSRPNCPRVVVDYAHTPDAVLNALQALRSQVNGKLIAVLGCGGDRDQSKRVPMARNAAENADACWFTSDNPRFENPQDILDQMVTGADGEHIQVVEQRDLAIRQAIESANVDDLVLVLGKGHEEYQEIAGKRVPFSDAVRAEEILDERMTASEQS